MKHTYDATTPKIRVHLQFTPEEVAANPYSACAEGFDITLDLTLIGPLCAKAIGSKGGRCTDANGALVVSRRKTP